MYKAAVYKTGRISLFNPVWMYTMLGKKENRERGQDLPCTFQKLSVRDDLTSVFKFLRILSELICTKLNIHYYGPNVHKCPCNFNFDFRLGFASYSISISFLIQIVGQNLMDL